MQTAATVVIPLVDGRRLIVSADELSVAASDGSILMSMDRNSITAVRRGGRELVITRRAADPLVATAVMLVDAQHCVQLLAAEESRPPSSSRWWRRAR